jgi:hypothetical protein
MWQAGDNYLNTRTMKTHIMKKGSLIIGVAIAIMAMFTMVHKAEAQKNSTSISTKNGVYTYKSRRGSNGLDVEYDGKIVFADDDKSIKSISRGGYIRIRSTSFGNRREILAESDNGTTINYEYYEGRRRADFDENGKKWLADILLEVVRTTGIGAEGRVARFYKNGGVTGTLDEISDIRSDYVSHIYLQELLEIDGLSDNDLVKIAGYVPRELGSDHYITEVFKDYGDLFLKNDQTTEAFLSAITRMDSDHYVSIILKETLEQDLSNEMLVKVLDAAGEMNSDHYKSGIVMELLENDNIEEDNLKEIIDYSSDMSDHYKSGVLTKMLKNDQVSAKYYNDVLRSADEMSDHYRNNILNYLLDNEELSSDNFEIILKMADDMSDHYSTNTLKKLLEEHELSSADYDKVIKSVEQLSDHYTTIVIKSMLEESDLEDEQFDAIIDLTESMSDHYQSAVIEEVMENGDLSETSYVKIIEVSSGLSDHYKVKLLKELLESKPTKATLIKVIEGVADISSDYYASNLLLEICDDVKEDKELEEAFRAAMKNIGSDTYYGKVSRCIR